MRTYQLLAGAALAMTSVLAMAQNAPESLLPKAFLDPTPAPAPPVRKTPARPAATSETRPQPVRTAKPVEATPAPRATSSPVVQTVPAASLKVATDNATPDNATSGNIDGSGLSRIPTLDELAGMTPDDFDSLLGNKTSLDTPPAARRKLDFAGLIDAGEGGLAADSVMRENPNLIRLALSANQGALVSRWGHILLRRALASRLAPPTGMSAIDFAQLRIALLLRMGETDAARAVLQQVDVADYTPAMASLALDVYTRNADFTGMCPTMSAMGNLRDDAQWNVARDICTAFRGNAALALQKLDHDVNHRTMPKIDLLLAQKYVGAAGRSRRAVTIEWGDVTDMTPWRYGLAIATGLEPPASLMKDASVQYAYTTALAPMVGLERRAEAADHACAAGILSNAAMVDLYSQIYAAQDIAGDWEARAEALRDAYTQADPSVRLKAMQGLWNGAADAQARYSRMVLTAAAAARMAPSKDLSGDAGSLIASMLSAGYDANAMRWAATVEGGSQGWALLALADPSGGRSVNTGDIDTFAKADESGGKRKSGLLVAGLAGLGRIDAGATSRLSRDMGLNLDSQTRFTDAIDAAAGRGDTAAVVILAGFGMQGDDWQRMTPRYLLHIVSALRTVGLEAEARMIAAEAVARA